MTIMIILLCHLFFNPQICRSLAMDNKMKRVIHGDVGLSICDACCVGRNCNEAECFALKKGNLIMKSVQVKQYKYMFDSELNIVIVSNFISIHFENQTNIHRYY